MRLLLRLAAVLLGIAVVLVVAIRVRYGGGGGHFEDRTGEPELPASALEVVADLDLPPGNIAVSADGRVFFSFHPEARPPVQGWSARQRLSVAISGLGLPRGTRGRYDPTVKRFLSALSVAARRCKG